MWWDYDMGWGGWLIMAIAMASFWILVVLLFVSLLRTDGPAGSESSDARDILERRLARGEIDVEEYQQRLDAVSKARR